MPGETGPRSKALSLRAPIATEEERATFQRRLALASLVVFGLAFMFYAVQLVAVAIAKLTCSSEAAVSAAGVSLPR